MKKQEIINKYLNKYIPEQVRAPFYMTSTFQDRVDGVWVRKFLEANGFKVIANFNGLAITQDKYVMSSNGYFRKGVKK
jgi:hypothetical protein|tara:strand:+ start:495 stop:728 length:234 start_codon:yes stop_codon:yes gene_type:complete